MGYRAGEAVGGHDERDGARQSSKEGRGRAGRAGSAAGRDGVIGRGGEVL